MPLKRAGANFVALCPFHREKTPVSTSIPSVQIFHCFGCHKGGDVFTFRQGIREHRFSRRLCGGWRNARAFRWNTSKGAEDQLARHLKERLLQVHEQITQRWQNALATKPVAKSRGTTWPGAACPPKR